MRPLAVVVAVLSLVVAFGVVVWLGADSASVTVTPGKAAAREEDEFITPSKTGPHPQVELVEKEFHFGTMRQFDSSRHAFVVKNTGQAPLHLLPAGTTCSQCTISTLKKNVVPPGETAEVELEWTIKNPAMHFEQSATIKTNDPNNPSFILTIKGDVGLDLSIMPNDRWNLGGLDSNAGGMAEGYVFSQLEDSFEITKVEPSKDWLTVKFEPVDQATLQSLAMQLAAPLHATLDPSQNEKPIQMKCGYKVTVTAPGTGDIGPFTETVRLHTTVEKVPTIDISVGGSRPGPFQFFALPGTQYHPNAMLIDAGEFDAAKGDKVGLLVIPRGMDTELKLESVKASPDWLKVQLIPDGPQGTFSRYRLMVEIPPGTGSIARPATAPAEIRIRTNHPSAGEITLRVAFISR